MRHNILLSYRSENKNSLAFFCVAAVFFAIYIILQPLQAGLIAQSQNAQETGTSGQALNGGNTDTHVPGQGFADEDFGPQVEEGSAIWEIIKVILVLGLFVGGFYFFYKFISQKVGLNISGQEAIKTLSMVPVGPNKTIQIIDVAGKVFLIGVADNSINMLTEIREKDDIDRIRLLSSRSTPVQGKNFQEFVADQMGWIIDKINEKRQHGFKKPTVEEISEKDIDVSYLDNQKKRLKKINHENEE